MRAQMHLNPRVWHQIGLEFSHINIQGTIKPQGGGE
ncbi:hypothetical protein T12_8436 [Trichinella patagoniensis]|uniref:Uncharacterized protein n=1 Tax=Trichinella patagoniensis TaxID=990121 RepID=A0A0V0XD57_9BILA|nr:hypothetical protein T12_8436 [Trichinella patagoniensis]